jgi:hypothetical protein
MDNIAGLASAIMGKGCRTGCLSKATDLAEDLSASKDMFLANMSHEFRIVGAQGQIIPAFSKAGWIVPRPDYFHSTT